MSEFNAVCAAIRLAYGALVERGLDCVTRARDSCIAALLRKAFSECLNITNEGLRYEQIRQALGFDIPLLQGPESPELEDAIALSICDKCSGDPLSIGWIYQIWNEPLRQDNAWAVSYRELRQNENTQLGVVTQLFTDDYIADFLVRRSFDIQRLASPAISGHQLSVCDPACGVGHMLVHALRVMAHTRVSDGPRLHQPRVYGFDIDSHAVDLCRALLLLEWSRLGFRGDRALFWEYLQTAISVVKAPYGSLDRSSDNPTIRQKFDVVVANPPYLGRRKLSMALRAYLDKEYPAANVDLCAAFMQRCVELTVDGGSVGLVTMDKWLRLAGYRSLRRGSGSFGGLLGELTFDCVGELGARAFNAEISLHDGVRVALLCASKDRPSLDHQFAFLSAADITAYKNKVEQVSSFLKALQNNTWRVKIQQQDLERADNSRAFLRVSGLPEAVVNSSITVGDRANIVVGIQTNDDKRYVRHVWEIQPDPIRWRIHSKGGGYGRWCGLNRWVIDWAVGAPDFFRSQQSREKAERWNDQLGWCYTWFANGSLGMRVKDPGWSFGRAAASGVFPVDPALVGFLNSRVASACVRSIGGKIQLPEGVVKRIPIPAELHPAIGPLVDAAVTLRRELARHDPTDALCNPFEARTAQELMAIEALLLLVEGSIESHVETSLTIPREQSADFASRFGAPVAWHASVCGPDEADFWRLVPPVFRPFKDILLDNREYEKKSWVAAPTIPADVLCAGFGGRLRYDRSKWLLPVDGALEGVCRALSMHPIDAVVLGQREAQKNAELRRYLAGDWARRTILFIVLRRLNHRWWSKEYSTSREPVKPISGDDICQEILSELDMSQMALIDEGSVSRWLCTEFEKWQRKLFFGTSPLRIRKDTATMKFSFEHIWDAEPYMAPQATEILAVS